jgi:hypothetical protein
MTRLARSSTQLAITAVLAAALSFAVPIFLDRHEYAAAVINYTNNPSAENQASLRVASAKNQGLMTISHLAVAGILFVLMNTGWWFVKRRSHSKPSGSPRF